MYIPEFWIGVSVTMWVEIILLVVLGVTYTIKSNKKNKR